MGETLTSHFTRYIFIVYKAPVYPPLWSYTLGWRAGGTGAGGKMNLCNSMQKPINPFARNCRNTLTRAKLIAIRKSCSALYQNRQSAAALSALRLCISCGTIPAFVFRKTLLLLRRVICLVCGRYR